MCAELEPYEYHQLQIRSPRTKPFADQSPYKFSGSMYPSSVRKFMSSTPVLSSDCSLFFVFALIYMLFIKWLSCYMHFVFINEISWPVQNCVPLFLFLFPFLGSKIQSDDNCNYDYNSHANTKYGSQYTTFATMSRAFWGRSYFSFCSNKYLNTVRSLSSKIIEL